MTVHAPAERPRILAELTRRPGRTAYEVAGSLGYGKPESRLIARIIQRLHQDGVLTAVTEFRPAMGRPASVYSIAPPGTPPPPRRTETPAQAERRRARDRAGAARRRARAAGKTAPEPGDDQRLVLLRPAAASLGTAGRQAACRDAGPDLFFPPEDEEPQDRAVRVTKARAVCMACPIRVACLEVAQANEEVCGVFGAVDFETERAGRSTQTTRPAVAAAGRA
jgi:hypothetical protein